MFANWKLWLLATVVTCLGFQNLHHEASARTLSASPSSEQGDVQAAYATYTVWYRPGAGYRWSGVGGLSYYDASMLVREYWKKGWYAYMEIE